MDPADELGPAHRMRGPVAPRPVEAGQKAGTGDYGRPVGSRDGSPVLPSAKSRNLRFFPFLDAGRSLSNTYGRRRLPEAFGTGISVGCPRLFDPAGTSFRSSAGSIIFRFLQTGLPTGERRLNSLAGPYATVGCCAVFRLFPSVKYASGRSGLSLPMRRNDPVYFRCRYRLFAHDGLDLKG